MKTLHSKRKYIFSFIEANYAGSGDLTLLEILDVKLEFEYIYVMQENIDLILDLKVGERLQLKFNRDYEDSDGFIKRIE